MNLKQLQQTIELEISQLHDYENPEDIPVLITLSESSIGARAASIVNCAGRGIDWEHGQFRLEPSGQLVMKRNALLDIKPMRMEQHDGKTIRWCPQCGNQVRKNDNYCSWCGQRMK